MTHRVSVLFQSGNQEAAFLRFREMQAMGLQPDHNTFGALLHCCAQVGNDRLAARCMRQMRSAGIQPTVQAYTSLIDAYVTANNPTSLAAAFQVS